MQAWPLEGGNFSSQLFPRASLILGCGMMMVFGCFCLRKRQDLECLDVCSFGWLLLGLSEWEWALELSLEDVRGQEKAEPAVPGVLPWANPWIHSCSGLPKLSLHQIQHQGRVRGDDFAFMRPCRGWVLAGKGQARRQFIDGLIYLVFQLMHLKRACDELRHPLPSPTWSDQRKCHSQGSARAAGKGCSSGRLGEDVSVCCSPTNWKNTSNLGSGRKPLPALLSSWNGLPGVLRMWLWEEKLLSEHFLSHPTCLIWGLCSISFGGNRYRVTEWLGLGGTWKITESQWEGAVEKENILTGGGGKYLYKPVWSAKMAMYLFGVSRNNIPPVHYTSTCLMEEFFYGIK